MPRTLIDNPKSPGRCAYCDGPLAVGRPEAFPDSRAKAPRYCCYGCRLLGESGHKPIPALGNDASPWFKIIVGAVIAGQAMLLGLAVNLAPPAGLTRLLLHAALIVSSILVFIQLGPPLLRSAMDAVRERRVSIELLFLAGIGGAFFASLLSTLTGQGAVYYEIVAILVTVYAIGKTLGAQSRGRALAESRKLQTTFAVCQKLSSEGTITVTPVNEIITGERVRVLPGEPIPIDGRIESGQAFVRDTPLTGEPFPVVRRSGDEVYAGSYSEDGELTLVATTDGFRRKLDGLLAAVENARDLPTAIQAQADRLVRWFLPSVLVAALGTFGVWTWRESWSVGLFNALAVLLVACPCAMGLATPIALWNALAVLAARGLVARSGDVIERLGSLTHLVFDKTGTLSEESLSLIDLAVIGNTTERSTLMSILRAVQAHSAHPVARAFRQIGTEDVLIQVKALKTIPARGIETWVVLPTGGELALRIGQRELMTDFSAEAELLQSLRHLTEDKLVYIQVDNRLAAVAAVRERLRDSTNEAMTTLDRLGLQCSVLTGDRAARAAQLGLRDVLGGLTPQEKAEQISRLRQRNSRVGFVGDGINDAPAMCAAAVGIALAHGAGVTTASANVVLYGGDLRILPWAIALCRKVRMSIKSNLYFAATYNAVGIVLAATGFLHPVTAALLMVGSSFTVAWRALRSTVSNDLCCFSTQGALSLPVTNRQSAAPASSALWHSRYSIYGLLLALQSPFLIYLGKLPLGTAAVLTLTLGGLGFAIARFRTANSEWSSYANMTFAMLGLGNWGMLLGWWADMGFAPIPWGASCCSAKAGFALSSFMQMPWMNLGMLLMGLPPMITDPANLRRGLGRVPLAVISAAGMVYGMSFGNYVFLHYLQVAPSQRLPVSYAGMSIGMLAGMFFCCELGRALNLWWRSRGFTAPSL